MLRLLVVVATAAAAPASLFSEPVSVHFQGEPVPPARARPAKVPRDDSLRGKLARTALKAVTYASRRTSEGLQRASNYLDGTATRAEGARQLLKTLKKKDTLSTTRRKRFWPSPRPTPSYNATTRSRKRDVLRQSTQSLVFRCLGVAAELWRRFNLLRERSLLGMLVLAFALGRATLSPTKRDPFHKKRRWSALLYLLLKWLCVVFSLRAVLRDPSLTVWKSKFYGVFVLNRRVVLHAIFMIPARRRDDAGSSPLDGASAAASSPRNDFHTGPSTGRASKLMQNRRCPGCHRTPRPPT